MDNYLILFTGELDEAFKPETLFPEKKSSIREWLRRNFTIRKTGKKHQEETSTTYSRAEVEYA
jgi:hypothetical protein